MRKRGEETAPASAGGAPAVLALGELGGEPGQEVVDLVHDVAARPEREALRRDVPRRQARRGRRVAADARQLDGDEAEELVHLLDPVAVRLARSEEHTSELQSRPHLVCRLLLEKTNT